MLDLNYVRDLWVSCAVISAKVVYDDGFCSVDRKEGFSCKLLFEISWKQVLCIIYYIASMFGNKNNKFELATAYLGL